MNRAIDRYVAYFETLTPERLDALDTVFDDTARFKDPFNDVRGLDAIRHVFEDMYERCESPQFRVDQAACQGDTCFISWTFRFRRGGHDAEIDGVSRVRFDHSERAIEHIDFWDPASQLYEGIPLLGGLLKALRRRLSADRAKAISPSTHQPVRLRQRGI